MGKRSRIFDDSLFWAVSDYDSSIIAEIIECNGDVNVVDSENRTPLHLACSLGNKDIVWSLLRHGAKSDALDSWGRSPLAYAITTGNKSIVSVLSSFVKLTGADLQIALCRYAALGDTEIIHFLLEKGVPANSLDFAKKSALHLACTNGHRQTRRGSS